MVEAQAPNPREGEEVSRIYRSFAEWPAETFTAADGSHVSTDEHDTMEEAESVCCMLKRHGFGGNGPHPIRTWAEKIANPSSPVPGAEVGP